MPLDVFHQPLALALLAWREFIAPTFVGVITGLEDHSYGCSLQAKYLAKAIGQIAPVGIGKSFRLIAVNDDYGRIASSLMRMTQLDAAAANQWRRVGDYGLFEFPGQAAGSEVSRCRRVSTSCCRQQIADGRAV